jgi:molybdopterin molybdotransferase
MKTFIGFEEALELTLANVVAGEAEVLALDQLTGKILSEDIVAKVDSPCRASSRKDGYAVISSDLAGATEKNPVKLEVLGQLSAGEVSNLQITAGQAVRVTTGAPLPDGADAVLSE